VTFVSHVTLPQAEGGNVAGDDAIILVMVVLLLLLLLLLLILPLLLLVLLPLMGAVEKMEMEVEVGVRGGEG
jgi:hypothetical protein